MARRNSARRATAARPRQRVARRQARSQKREEASSSEAARAGLDARTGEAPAREGPLTARRMLAMQATHGNAHVQRLARAATGRAVPRPGELARADKKPKPPGFIGKAVNRIKQLFGYKLGSKKSKKVLSATFDGRKFDVSKVNLLDASGIKAAWDKIYGEGTYDGTCDGCTEADGPLEGFAHGGKIYINTDAQVIDTVTHEILHTAENGAVYTEMGERANEGFTEYLTQKAARAFGFKPSSSYPGELSATQKLAALVGDAAIEAAYFDGDTAGLKKAVNKHKAGAFKKFVKGMKAETYGVAKSALE